MPTLYEPELGAPSYLEGEDIEWAEVIELAPVVEQSRPYLHVAAKAIMSGAKTLDNVRDFSARTVAQGGTA